MRRITRAFCEKVARDVDLIQKKAAVVLRLNGGSVEITHNDKPIVNVVGIIGPGETASGYHFQKAVLEEIGIGPSRPYHTGKVPEIFQEADKPKCFSYRFSGFGLSDEQYRIVAPIAFKIIQELADRRVAGWKSGTPNNPYYVSGVRFRYNKRKEGLEWDSIGVPKESGTRFSIALKSPFAADICWAGLRPTSSFARLINMRLGHRLERRRPSKAYRIGPRQRRLAQRQRKGIEELKRFKDVLEMLVASRLPKWLLPNIILQLPEGEKNPFAIPLRAALNWQKETTPEWEMAANSLPGLKSRLNGLRLKLISGAGNGKDYITFEVFPSSKWHTYVPKSRQPWILDDWGAEDELPF